MAETAAHHKQMEDLMTAEALWKPVKYRQLQSVEDTADGVNDAAGQKPSEGCRRERCHQRLEDQNTCPAHGDIDNGAYPVRAVDDKYLKSDADKSGRPDEKEKRDTAASRQSQQADRRVGTGNEDEDHSVVNAAKQQVHLGGNVQRVIEAAGAIKKNHTSDKNRHGKNSSVAVALYRFKQQREGADDSSTHGNEMSNRASGIF